MLIIYNSIIINISPAVDTAQNRSNVNHEFIFKRQLPNKYFLKSVREVFRKIGGIFFWEYRNNYNKGAAV